MMTRHIPSMVVIAAAAVLAGCASDSTSAPSSQTSLDLGALLGQVSLGNLGSIPGAASVLSMPMTMATPPFSPSACSYSESVQGFVCPTVTSGGLTFNVTYFLYDAAGHSQKQGDALTTASIRTVTDAKGTTSMSSMNGTDGTVTLSNHGEMTMTGLLTSTRILNGSSTSHYDMTLTGSTALHAVMDMTTVTKDLTLPTQTAAQPWPLSGTITADGKNATSSGTAATLTTITHSVITFTGTSTATAVTTMTTPAGSVTMTCTMDLSGKTAPSCTSA